MKDNPRKIDYASDEKSEKNITREMFRMTGRINKKFFDYKKTAENPVPPVGCVTCHNGKAHPEHAKAAEEKKESSNWFLFTFFHGLILLLLSKIN